MLLVVFQLFHQFQFSLIILFVFFNHGIIAQTIEWEKNYGGSDRDLLYSIIQTTDNGYIFVGESRSTDGDVSSNEGSQNFWVVKLDQERNIEWEKSLGGSDLDRGHKIVQASNGNFIVGGSSRSSDGDVSENKGDFDIWLVEVSPPINTANENLEVQNFKIYPNPSSGDLIVSLDSYNSGGAVQIYDLFGRLVHSQKINRRELRIKNLPKGIYTFSIIRGGISTLEKVFIH